MSHQQLTGAPLGRPGDQVQTPQPSTVVVEEAAEISVEAWESLQRHDDRPTTPAIASAGKSTKKR